MPRTEKYNGADDVEEQVLTRKEAAEFLKIHPVTLSLHIAKLRAAGLTAILFSRKEYRFLKSNLVAVVRYAAANGIEL